MSDYLSYTLAKQQINERVEQSRRSHIPGQRRRSRRHSVASGLHSLANRIDR